MKFRLIILLLLYYFPALAQLSLDVKKLNYDENKHLIPNIPEVIEKEKSSKGHFFEISIKNNSDKIISLPIDTTTFAMPLTEDLSQFFTNTNINEESDLYNVLGIHAFVHQSNKFIEFEIDEPFDLEIEIPSEFFNLKEKRKQEIENWGKKNKIKNDTMKVFNWYLIKNMKQIQPHQTLVYKIFFNPFLKMDTPFSHKEFYFPLKHEESYTLNFQLIRNKNLYRFLTKGQKLTYKNLFMGNLKSGEFRISP